jgi:predicted dehydrogenase
MTDRNSPYRAALIGCGRIGADCNPPGVGSSRIQSHAQAYFDHPNTQLVAAFDLDSARLQSSGERWQIPRLYTDLGSMLRTERIDILSISTPANTHLEILERILKADSVAGVLLEKPIALNVEQAVRMQSFAQKSRTKIAVNYIRRYLPAYNLIREKYIRGELGAIQHVRVAYTKGVMNNASHAIDLLRFFFGDPCDVQVLTTLGNADQPDPTLHFRLDFHQGFEAWFVALDAHAYNVFDVEIFGTQGRILFGDLGHSCQFYPVVDTNKTHGFMQLEQHPTEDATHLDQAIRHAVDQLVAAIEKDAPLACTLEDGIAALKLSTELINQSKFIGSKRFYGN